MRASASDGGTLELARAAAWSMMSVVLAPLRFLLMLAFIIFIPVRVYAACLAVAALWVHVIQPLGRLIDEWGAPVLATTTPKAPAPSRGPEMLVGSVQATGAAACPVCRRPVDGGLTCERCATPHHADCWSYNAGCAIYGCSQRGGWA